ncbi:MAG: DUF5009 domain-containing protein [Armatimonadota bacterium]|nr:DUF5009 domain-containing protein [Armatimonadota bacterium]
MQVVTVGRSLASSASAAADASPADAAAARVASLDAFRGFLIFWMLLANHIVWSPSIPVQLRHAPWGAGVTLTDVVFPWFLFVMGVAIPLSAARSRQAAGGLPPVLRILRRSFLLVVLGLVVYTSVYGRLYLGLGILQVLGLTYLVAATTARLPVGGRAALCAALVLGHWALLKFAPVPGVGSGVLEPGRNILHYLNTTYFQRYHLAGLASLVPTSAIVIAGTLAGEVFARATLPAVRRIGWLVGGGVALTLAGWLWQLEMPFNRALWTPSLVLWVIGTGALAVGVLYGLLDVRGWRAVALPLVVLGSNAILVYMGAILFRVYVVQRLRLPVGSEGPTLHEAVLGWLVKEMGALHGAWAYASAVVAFWWLVLFVLYRRRIFLRL